MPFYEYRCTTCDEVFEVSRPMAAADDVVACPTGHRKVRRLLSVFAAVGNATASGPTPSASPASGGGCCGGACGCR